MWNWVKDKWAVLFLIAVILLFLGQVGGMAYLFVEYSHNQLGH